MELDNGYIAYAFYLTWLVAGFTDFMLHRRTDLPHTSGLHESAFHLLQLALIGAALASCLLFEMGRSVAVLLVALVSLHAVCGYLDTRWAFRRRMLSPMEQHIHSVLDMAPIVGLAWVTAATWPAAITGGWNVTPRQPALDPGVWFAVLLPALLLCVVPAALEFRAAWKARVKAPAGPWPSAGAWRRRLTSGQRRFG